MPTSLQSGEREVLERLVEALKRELGDELRAVWLYGSAARGETRHEGSDVDVLVIADDLERARALVPDLVTRAGNEDWGQSPLSVHVEDPAWLAKRRSIEAFFIAEVDRDKVVLAGDGLDDLPLDGIPERGLGMRERSRELLDKAGEKLLAAELNLAHELYGPALGAGYDALLAAARAALSEEGFHAKTHSGTWNLFHVHLVATGRLPRAFHTAGARGQKKREDEVYAAWAPSAEDARQMVEAARELVDAVAAAYGG